MQLDQRIQIRFQQLEHVAYQNNHIRTHYEGEGIFYDSEKWHQWSTSALHLLQLAFGTQSVHFQNFKKIYESPRIYPLDEASGVLAAAKEDYEGGYVTSLQTAISGEIFGDFVALAKQSLADKHKDVAAVLACAALEDALKRYASAHGINVDNKKMRNVIKDLASKGLIVGTQKSLLDQMSNIRNLAMHAKWDKFTPADVNSVIGYVEQFLLIHF